MTAGDALEVLRKVRPGPVVLQCLLTVRSSLQMGICVGKSGNRSYLMRMYILQVDEIYINTIREYGLYDQIWQAFAVFLPVRSVGVQVWHTHVNPQPWPERLAARLLFRLSAYASTLPTQDAFSCVGSVGGNNLSVRRGQAVRRGVTRVMVLL